MEELSTLTGDGEPALTRQGQGFFIQEELGGVTIHTREEDQITSVCQKTQTIWTIHQVFKAQAQSIQQSMKQELYILAAHLDFFLIKMFPVLSVTSQPGKLL